MTNPLIRKNSPDTSGLFKRDFEDVQRRSESESAPLKKAMQAVDADIDAHTDRFIDTDETIIIQELEQKMTAELEMGIQGEIVKDLTVPARDGGKNGDISGDSSIVLETQSKQESTKDMVARIRTSSDSLSGIAKQAELLVKHLEKTEAELTRLGKCEANAARLSQTSFELMKRQKDNALVIAELNKRISLLENKNDAIVSDHEAAKMDIVQLEEKNGKQTFEIQERDSVIAHLKSEKQALIDKVELMNAEHERVRDELTKMRENLDNVAASKKESEKLAAKNDALNSELRQHNEQTTAELNDLQSRYDSLRDRYLEQGADLKKKVQESDSLRRELEEKLRLSRQRSIDLEKKLAVTDKSPATDFELDERSFTSMATGLESEHQKMASKQPATKKTPSPAGEKQSA